jgi:hypothetical protein
MHTYMYVYTHIIIYRNGGEKRGGGECSFIYIYIHIIYVYTHIIIYRNGGEKRGGGECSFQSYNERTFRLG